MGFGAIVKYHYDGGKKYQFLVKPVMKVVSVPKDLKDMIKYKTLSIYKIKNAPPKLKKHSEKKRFTDYIQNNRNALLLLPQYDHSIGRSFVDVIDLNNFELIHTYKHDITATNNIVTNTNKFPRLKIDDAQIRFQYRHPVLLEDGSLITRGTNAPLFKIDICSDLIWLNDQERFHHSHEIDHEGNIWVGGQLDPKSKFVDKFKLNQYIDDSIIKINTDGVILFNKSVTEILIENNIFKENFALNASLSYFHDPIHLNDIEPALSDTNHWKKGDVFLSVRNQSAIVHYRPKTNKIINYIIGNFAWQHDVDIISDNEISIFNNNNFYTNNDYSEVLIYNFDTKQFRKLFNNQLQQNDFKTFYQGLSHIFKDGSLMVEEQEHGRIILFNSKGKKEWEFVNKDKNDDIGLISWSRIIEDELFIENFKSLIKTKKCLK